MKKLTETSMRKTIGGGRLLKTLEKFLGGDKVLSQVGMGDIITCQYYLDRVRRHKH